MMIECMVICKFIISETWKKTDCARIDITNSILGRFVDVIWDCRSTAIAIVFVIVGNVSNGVAMGCISKEIGF